ncbi:Piwi domain-containing protein [Mycena vitilis]|nr:Piwi domain-containing protein [Mycena vitilis]
MGIFQSVRPTINRLVINVDTTVGVVVPETMLQRFCQDFARTDRLSRINPQVFQSLRNFLHGIKISINIPGRPQREVKIKDLVRDVGNQTFEKNLPGNQVRTIRVAEHFREQHNMTIITDTLGVKVGNHELFPIDICRTVNQLYKNKLPPQFTPAVLKFLPGNPAQRLQKIKQAWEHMEYKNSQFLQGGIRFDPSSSPMKIMGRLLPAPGLARGPNQTEQLRESGVWDMQHKPLAGPADPFLHWICANFTGNNDPRLKNFVDELWQVLDRRGIKCDRPRYISANPYSIEKTLKAEIDAKWPKLIVAFLPDPAPEPYIAVKRFGDIEYGIPTQCVRWSSKLSNNSRRDQYENNLVLKINTRLGGINFVPQSPAMAELGRRPTMVLGADVSHPGSGSTLPSVAALVASWDPVACKYTASVRVQSSRVEIIQDLEAMVATALKTFFEKWNSPPQRIVYYRDGVSEGQFDMVLQAERAAIQAALQKSGYYTKDSRPLFIFIICGKKHHIRFFPDAQDADPRGNKNFPAGFIGDRDIGHPFYKDFYLQSQKGLQGTSRPCHYTVLVNGIGWNMDMIQQITYSLCYCYSRATRSVKIPAPVYYADLVCGRAKFHYDKNVDFEDAMSVSSDDPEYGRKQYEFYQAHFDQVHSNFQGTSAFSMYFV